MDTNDPVLSLIVARLNQTASQQQQQQLQQWIESSPGNREEYELYVRIWKESGAALSTPAFDSDAAWMKVASQISTNANGEGRKQGPGKLTSLYLKRMAVAASVIVLVGTGYYLWIRSTFTYTRAVGVNRLVVLPDGSVVTLRKGSSLTYKPRFDQAERTVQLAGEAFFQVIPDKARPFLVRTSQTQVRVTGTSFLIRSGRGVEEVMVTSGKVVVTDRKRDKELQLVAGQKAVLHGNQLEQVQLTDSNYIAWKTGRLNFINTPLARVLEDLEQYYAVPVKTGSKDSATLNKMTITVRFENQPLQQALDELALITGLQVRKDGNTFLLYKE